MILFFLSIFSCRENDENDTSFNQTPTKTIKKSQDSLLYSNEEPPKDPIKTGQHWKHNN